MEVKAFFLFQPNGYIKTKIITIGKGCKIYWDFSSSYSISSYPKWCRCLFIEEDQ